MTDSIHAGINTGDDISCIEWPRRWEDGTTNDKPPQYFSTGLYTPMHNIMSLYKGKKEVYSC